MNFWKRRNPVKSRIRSFREDIINTGGGYDGSAKIVADVFSNDLRVTFIRFCMDIKTIFMVSVDGGFYRFERRADAAFRFIQKSGLERIP